jgi:FtsZ-interacting cell division protein ZipA
VILAVYVVLYFLVPRAPTGFMTLLTILLVIGGIQLFCLAVIGDYVARVLEEVKQRPHFLVKSVFNDPAEHAARADDEAPAERMRLTGEEPAAQTARASEERPRELSAGPSEAADTRLGPDGQPRADDAATPPPGTRRGRHQGHAKR